MCGAGQCAGDDGDDRHGRNVGLGLHHFGGEMFEFGSAAGIWEEERNLKSRMHDRRLLVYLLQARGDERASDEVRLPPCMTPSPSPTPIAPSSLVTIHSSFLTYLEVTEIE